MEKTNSIFIKIYGKSPSGAVTINGENYFNVGLRVGYFPGGEKHVEIPEIVATITDEVLVVARMGNAEALMELLLVKAALNSLGIDRVHLVMPYFPYARQDRVCNKGEAHGAAVFARVINEAFFDSVTVWDIHSSRAKNCLHRVREVEQWEIFAPRVREMYLNGYEHVTLVSPDYGASRKTHKIGDSLIGDEWRAFVPIPSMQIIMCSKNRNPQTGEIESFVVPEVRNQDYPHIIVDDICDGGGTFIGIAKELKKQGAGRIELWVTHGIFSKGLDVFKGLIDRVVYTNSGCEQITPEPVLFSKDIPA